jgi:hypothetical protein
VHVDDHRIRGQAQRAGFQFAVDRRERIVHRRHVDKTQDVHDQDTLA